MIKVIANYDYAFDISNGISRALREEGAQIFPIKELKDIDEEIDELITSGAPIINNPKILKKYWANLEEIAKSGKVKKMIFTTGLGYNEQEIREKLKETKSKLEFMELNNWIDSFIKKNY